jgi:signal transduction histidine kinase
MSERLERARILIVDDDEGLLILMAGVLRSEEYEVATAASGSAAIRWLERHTADLILLDLKLPDMDGTTLLAWLREQQLKVAFVVVTGRGDEKVAVETMRQGGLDYVMKDTGLLDLLPEVVRRALNSIRRDRALSEAQAEGRRFEREIVSISEKERSEIGADLHDGLGQQLTAIELICTGLKEDVGELRPDLLRRLEQMGQMLREAISQTRVLARGLVPINQDPEALTIALAELAERMDSMGSVRCRFECADSSAVNDSNVSIHLYRIAQEAVNNAIKHAGAKRIAIRFGSDLGGPWLEVADDGRGLPKKQERIEGLGLRLMRHRAGVIGANLTISENSGAGVIVRCDFNKKPKVP